MTVVDTPTGLRERCPRCGAYCGVAYTWSGPSYHEQPYCTNCGLNTGGDA